LDLPQESPHGEGSIKQLWSMISFQEMSKGAHAYDDSKEQEQEQDKPGKKIDYGHLTISFLGCLDSRSRTLPKTRRNSEVNYF
jgi:hypothetical protein